MKILSPWLFIHILFFLCIDLQANPRIVSSEASINEEKKIAYFAPFLRRKRATGSGLTETQFNRLIEDGFKIYDYDHSDHGMNKAKILTHWDDNTQNAGAFIDPVAKDWGVNFYGGLARINGMTEDAYSVIICHEFGHLFGGVVFKTFEPTGQVILISSEGNSDYFASNTCLKSWWLSKTEENRIARIKSKDNPRLKIPYEHCQKISSDENLQNLCMRVAIAALKISDIYLWEPGTGPKPSFETPSVKSVFYTIEKGYPSPQCRLDIFFAASKCEKIIPVGVIPGSEIYELGEDKSDEKREIENQALEEYSCGYKRLRCWWSPEI